MTKDELLAIVDNMTAAFDSIPREDRGKAPFKSAGDELAHSDHRAYLTVISKLHHMAYFLTDIASSFPMPDVLEDHLRELDRKKLEDNPALRRYYIDAPHMYMRAGDNEHLFVTAPDPSTAFKLWMAHYEIYREDLRENWTHYADVRLALVPQLGEQPMAHPWGRVLQWNPTQDGLAGPHTNRD